LQFTLSFDSTILSPAATNPVALGSLVPSNFSVSANTATAGQITVVISPPITSPIPSFNSGSGPVAQITLQVASTTSEGATSPLTLSNLSASDPNGNAVTLSAQNGTFTVTRPAVLRGDVNEDGLINVQDLIRLIQHLTGERPLTGNGLLAADINGDGVVNVQDLIRLIQHLTGERPLSPPSASSAMMTSPGRDIAVGERVWSAEGLTVPIMLNDGSGIAAAQMVIEYDPAQLQIDESVVATLGELVPEGFQLQVNPAELGRVVVVLVPPVKSPILTLSGGPGALFHLRFVSVAEPSDASVRIVQAVFSDNAGRLIPAQLRR
jgi:hypothetical protein